MSRKFSKFPQQIPPGPYFFLLSCKFKYRRRLFSLHMVVNRSREAWKTYGNVFDSYTNRLLQRLSGQGLFEELETSIALGKEANVFSARNGDEQVAIKIYRLENCNFNKMFSYIAQDPRYSDLKGDKRRIIFAWTQREYRNLLKAREHIRVPTPIAFKDHILVTEFIGDEQAAPQLKDVHLEDPEGFFKEILEMVALLLHGAGLVHGDLSQFNILVHHDEPVFIDFSQGTAKESGDAKKLLRRDLEVLCNYFARLGAEYDIDLVYDCVTKNTLDKL